MKKRYIGYGGISIPLKSGKKFKKKMLRHVLNRKFKITCIEECITGDVKTVLVIFKIKK